MAENENERIRHLMGRIWASIIPNPVPQDYLDLDAAGYLLVALGLLVKAREKLDQEPPSSVRWHVKQHTIYAANYVRRGLKLLDEQKEETCKKS